VRFLLSILLINLCVWSAGPASGSGSGDVAQLIEKGDDYLSADDFSRAIAVYRQVVSSSPGNAQAHQRLGKALCLAGNVAGAEREMRQAVALDPQNALAHSNLGMILGMERKFREAAAQEQIAIRLDPYDAFPYRALGSALAALGYFDYAIPAFRDAIELDPTNLNAYVNLGATLGRKHDYAEAAEAYRQAIKVEPASVAAHLGLGAALGKLGETTGQIAEYRRAVSLDPNNDSAHGKLGWALYRAGRWQGALREGCITNWLRLSRHGPEYLQFFLSLWAGVFLLFGLVFAVMFFGSRFIPAPGETVLKSYFLTFNKEKPGRFVITNRRLVFVPEWFSKWFGAADVSVERADIEAIESSTAGGSGSLNLELKDGSRHEFKIPHLVLKPLLDALSESRPEAAASPSSRAARAIAAAVARRRAEQPEGSGAGEEEAAPDQTDGDDK